MDTLLDDVASVERRCERAAEKFKRAMEAPLKRLVEAAADIGRAWSGSWIGYQSRVYYAGFKAPPVNDPFSVEWGLSSPTRPTGWREWRFEDVVGAILHKAGSPDLEAFKEPRLAAQEIFEESQDDLVASLEAAIAEKSDARLSELIASLTKIKIYSVDELARAAAPKGTMMSRDRRAIADKIHTPPHVQVEAQAQALYSVEIALRDVAASARRTKIYLEKRLKLKGRGIARSEGKIFIGHGGSAVWRDLKDFLSERLGLEPDEFNLEPTAGLTTKERLEEMLDAAVFAFIVMTAEDEHADTTKHARENVIHEAGLFQGRLGFRRAIILLEDGCAEFSNIQGLTQIRFPVGNVMAKSEEIRRVLEREGLAAKVSKEERKSGDD